MPINIEGLYNLDINNKGLIWSQPLQTVITPIVINNNYTNYLMMVSQSRFTFGGKVSIEVNKGFLDKNTNDNNRWRSLLNRKFPYFEEEVEIINVVDLGYYWQHTDWCDFQIPVQAVFSKTMKNTDISVLKKKLKTRHDYCNEPKKGPPLHNNEPNIKSLEEVKQRINDIFEFPEKTNEEIYLNDVFSITALSALFNYIDTNGYPY